MASHTHYQHGGSPTAAPCPVVNQQACMAEKDRETGTARGIEPQREGRRPWREQTRTPALKAGNRAPGGKPSRSRRRSHCSALGNVRSVKQKKKKRSFAVKGEWAVLFLEAEGRYFPVFGYRGANHITEHEDFPCEDAPSIFSASKIILLKTSTAVWNEKKRGAVESAPKKLLG
ncbi:UNVERIFIED_CONTAM: hypothetical protein K2H54_013664 [Gekko kuhli]